MKKKLCAVLSALLLCLVACFAAACGDGRTEISIGYWINNTNERQNNQYIFDAFEEAYPEYKIKAVPINYDSYGEEVPRMFTGGTLPDVIWLREEYLPIFAEEGVIIPIDEYVEADEEFDGSKYVHNALEFCSYDGSLYALPHDIGVQVMAFNLDIMGDTPLPENDWTWEDMVELGKQFMVQEGDSYSQYGLGWLDWKCLVYSNGGTLFADGGTRATFNDPKTVDALQFYSDLANDPDTMIMPSAEASQGLGNPFIGKKAAFAVVGSWDFVKLQKVPSTTIYARSRRARTERGPCAFRGCPSASTARAIRRTWRMNSSSSSATARRRRLCRRSIPSRCRASSPSPVRRSTRPRSSPRPPSTFTSRRWRTPS